MPLSFASSYQAFFDRIGSLGGIISQTRSCQVALEPLLRSNVIPRFADEPDIQAILGQSYTSMLNAVPGNLPSTMQGMASQILTRMIYDDTGLFLSSTDAMTELIRQMGVAGATVLRQTVAATVGAFSGQGNGVLVASVKRPQDGLTQENQFAETGLVLCTTDSYGGGATEGNEGFVLTGDLSANLFDWNWPLGSNGSLSISAIDGSADNSSNNLLTNSGFEEWTGNIPDNWTLSTGTGGVNVFQETTLTYDPPPNEALRITGDAAGTLTDLRQDFDSSSSTVGTPGALQAVAQYAMNLFIRRDGTAPAVGVLTVDLIDGDENVIVDQAGVANTFTIDLTALSTNYASYSVAFRTPYIMPDEATLRLRLSTALTSGRSIYIDKVSFGLMSRFYPGGPYFSIHAGSIPFKITDRAEITMTNGRGSGGSLNSFQTLLMALLLPEMLAAEMLLPSSTVPSISDGLIA